MPTKFENRVRYDSPESPCLRVSETVCKVTSDPPYPTRILLIDDDSALRSLISAFLQEHGYQVMEAEDGVSGRALLEANTFDIVVLDVMMPGEDGLSIARSLAGRGDTGIIMASALGSETDRIIGLEVGADDYLPKPISPRELLARIRAVHRRRTFQGPESGADYVFLGWRLDPIRRFLRDPSGVVITLSDGEFSLLLALVERPLRTLTRDQLIELVKGHNSEVFDRAIDTQISRLRRKLATRTKDEMVRTVRNEGYMFLPEVSRARA